MTKVPGLETQKALRRDRRGADHRHGAGVRPRQPVVVLNARTRERHLDLGGDRLEPGSDTEDVTLLIRPGRQLRRGRALHRRAAQPARARTARRSRRPRASASTATACSRRTRDVEARRDHFESLFGTLAEAGIDRDSLYRAWDFTVASERNLIGARAHDPRRRVRAARRHEPGRHEGARARRPSSRSRRSRRTPRTSSRCGSRAGTRCRATSTLPNCASGGTFTYPSGSTNGPPAIPEGSTTTARFQCNIPKSATDARRVTAVALRPRPARQPRRGEPGPAARLRPRAQLHLLRDRLDRAWRAPTCPTRTRAPTRSRASSRRRSAGSSRTATTRPCSRSSSDMSNFPQLADRVQQGLVNFLYLGPADDPPGRLLERPELPGGRPEPDRHAPALLRRQQPGRDHRRRAHRGGRRPRPRRPRRAGDELLDAARRAAPTGAPASRRASSTCRSTRGSCTRRIRTSSSASSSSR